MWVTRGRPSADASRRRRGGSAAARRRTPSLPRAPSTGSEFTRGPRRVGGTAAEGARGGPLAGLEPWGAGGKGRPTAGRGHKGPGRERRTPPLLTHFTTPLHHLEIPEHMQLGYPLAHSALFVPLPSRFFVAFHLNATRLGAGLGPDGAGGMGWSMAGRGAQRPDGIRCPCTRRSMTAILGFA